MDLFLDAGLSRGAADLVPLQLLCLLAERRSTGGLRFPSGLAEGVRCSLIMGPLVDTVLDAGDQAVTLGCALSRLEGLSETPDVDRNVRLLGALEHLLETLTLGLGQVRIAPGRAQLDRLRGERVPFQALP